MKDAPLLPEERLLLAAARVTLDEPRRAEIAAAVADGVAWDHVIERAQREGLAPLLHAHLQALPEVRASAPPWVLARLDAAYRMHWARNAALTAHWAEAMRALHAAGVEAISHKGIALIHTVYPEVALRPMADIDLLVRPADLPAVKRALAAAGFRTPDATLAAEEAFRAFLHFVRDGTVIDLHWEIAHYTRFEGIVRVDHAALWSRARPFEADGERGLGLAPEDALLHLALHLTLGSEFGRAIWFSDIDALLRRSAARFDWKAMAAEAGRWRVGAIVGYVLDVLRESFDTPVDPESVARLRPRRVRRAIVGAAIGTTSPPSITGRLADARVYLAQTVLMDRVRDVLRLFRFSFFPPRSWLRFHYAARSGWQVGLYQLLHPWRVAYLAVRRLR